MGADKISFKPHGRIRYWSVSGGRWREVFASQIPDADLYWFARDVQERVKRLRRGVTRFVVFA